MRSPPLQESSIFARKPHHLPRQAQKLRTGLTVPRDGTGLVVILTQQLARLAIEEVQPGAGLANDALIFGLWEVNAFVRPMLDVHISDGAGENEMGHRLFMGAP
jgi:hypothetical protein